jgi:hypothetical protein
MNTAMLCPVSGIITWSFDTIGVPWVYQVSGVGGHCDSVLGVTGQAHTLRAPTGRWAVCGPDTHSIPCRMAHGGVAHEAASPHSMPCSAHRPSAIALYNTTALSSRMSCSPHRWPAAADPTHWHFRMRLPDCKYTRVTSG